MAKKYLLYIHHSAFENEQKKSALVNKLLADHYGLDTRDDNTTSVATVSTFPGTKGTEIDNEIEDEELEEDRCEHGFLQYECKNYGCPYAPDAS